MPDELRVTCGAFNVARNASTITWHAFAIIADAFNGVLDAYRIALGACMITFGRFRNISDAYDVIFSGW